MRLREEQAEKDKIVEVHWTIISITKPQSNFITVKI